MLFYRHIHILICYLEKNVLHHAIRNFESIPGHIHNVQKTKEPISGNEMFLFQNIT